MAKKPQPEKRYKSTIELVGELISWLMLFFGISALTMTSFGATYSAPMANTIRAWMYTFGSFTLVSGIVFSITNRSAHRTNTPFSFIIHRLFGIITMLMVFGFAIMVMSIHSFSTSAHFQVGWMTINLIAFAIITSLAIVQISSSHEIKREKTQKVITNEMRSPIKRDPQQTEAIEKAIESFTKQVSKSDDELKIWQG